MCINNVAEETSEKNNVRFFEEENWKRILEEYPEAKEGAISLGLENSPQKVEKMVNQKLSYVGEFTKEESDFIIKIVWVRWLEQISGIAICIDDED